MSKIDRKRIKIEDKNYSLETHRGMKDGTFIVGILKHKKGLVGAFHICSHGRIKFEAEAWSANCKDCADDLGVPFMKKKRKKLAPIRKMWDSLIGRTDGFGPSDSGSSPGPTK